MVLLDRDRVANVHVIPIEDFVGYHRDTLGCAVRSDGGTFVTATDGEKRKDRESGNYR
ncbi:MAG: hypothetical protein DHS20C21_15630 [Gemmatimonadota bacterium]|nr:MAG: hypothetical protein DHS20C21_15630 [Gemmatimonadota bacterium]